MQKNFIMAGCVFAALAVALGAFGAHGLKSVLSPERLEIFETGVRYQFYHAFALLITGLAAHFYPNKLLKYAGYLFVIGILFFSGSIYLLACKNILKLGRIYCCFGTGNSYWRDHVYYCLDLILDRCYATYKR